MSGKAQIAHKDCSPASAFETVPSINRGTFLAAMGRVYSLVTIVSTDGPAAASR